MHRRIAITAGGLLLGFSSLFAAAVEPASQPSTMPIDPALLPQAPDERVVRDLEGDYRVLMTPDAAARENGAVQFEDVLTLKKTALSSRHFSQDKYPAADMSMVQEPGNVLLVGLSVSPQGGVIQWILRNDRQDTLKGSVQVTMPDGSVLKYSVIQEEAKTPATTTAP